MPEGPRKLLDASALLAYLQREPGFEAVREALREEAAIKIQAQGTACFSWRGNAPPLC